MVRIKDIASKAGVSYPVASLALSGRKSKSVKYSEETRQHVIDVANKLGYRPNRSARNFVKKRHGCLALLTDNLHHLTRLTMNALTMSALEQDMIVYVDRVPYGPGNLPRCLQEDMADGTMVFGHISPEVDQQLDIVGLPSVRINTNMTEGNGVITYDERGGMRQLVKAFAERGRKRIAMIDFGPSQHYSQDARKESLESCTAEFGMTQPVRETISRDSIQSYDLVQLLKSNPDIDALITHELYLPKIYHDIEAAGRRIGEDLSVLCYEADGVSQFFVPSCGGLALDKYKIGEDAIRVVTQLIAGKEVPTRAIPYTLTVRDSL